MYSPTNAQIHAIVRVILKHGSNIVLCRVPGQRWAFLPGGHIENGETSQQALRREIKEEMGQDIIGDLTFIGVCENTFTISDIIVQQEMNLIFAGNLDHQIDPQSLESKIEFFTVSEKELSEIDLRPARLKGALVHYLLSGEKRPLLVD